LSFCFESALSAMTLDAMVGGSGGARSNVCGGVRETASVARRRRGKETCKCADR